MSYVQHQITTGLQKACCVALGQKQNGQFQISVGYL